MKFNINEYVLVKLTAHGKELLIKDHVEFWKNYPQDIVPNNAVPEEDAEGYSKWQMWYLMQKFGHHCFNGCQIPFEMEIIIND